MGLWRAGRRGVETGVKALFHDLSFFHTTRHAIIGLSQPLLDELPELRQQRVDASADFRGQYPAGYAPVVNGLNPINFG